jgi:hypothetical protein
MASRIRISTTVFSKAYLAIAWKSRDDLTGYEKRGFVQFSYLTICEHVESLLSSIIKRRIDSIKHMLHWDKLPPIQFKNEDKIHYCELEPLVESLLRVLSRVADDTENAPLSKLIDLYSKVFSQSLKEVVGKELHEDLTALASLRNLFAHGRDLFIEFDAPFAEKATLDKNPLQKPAQRLHQVGIIKDFNITGQNYDEFQTLFFSDEALLYFYQAVQKIEESLMNSIGFFLTKLCHFYKNCLI